MVQSGLRLNNKPVCKFLHRRNPNAESLSTVTFSPVRAYQIVYVLHIAVLLIKQYRTRNCGIFIQQLSFSVDVMQESRKRDPHCVSSDADSTKQ